MALSKLRSDCKIDGIGSEKEDFAGVQLPTTREVMCVFFFELRACHNVREAARRTMRKVRPLWLTTTIPTVQEIRGIEKIEGTYKVWRGCEKHKKDRRVTEEGQGRVDAFQVHLDKLFDISKKDAEETMQKQIAVLKTETEKFALQEDVLFLEDQKGPRQRYIGDTDRKLKAHTLKRAREEEKRKEKLRKREERNLEEAAKLREEKLQYGVKVELESDSDDHTHCDEDNEPNSPPKRPRSRTSNQHNVKNVWTPEVVQAVDAAKLSQRNATVVVAAVAAALGVPVDQLNISHQSAMRRREEGRIYTVMKIKEELVPDRVLTVHWDGKELDSLDGEVRQGREAIVVTGVTTNQVLGCKCVKDGSAAEIATAVVECLEAWNLKENVKAASFDTTSVNSGHIGGAAVLIASRLGRELIWLPCRHHIFERVLEAVFHEVMGPSTGPDSKYFKLLAAKWNAIDKEKYIKYTDYAESRKHLDDCADSIIQYANSKLQGSFARGDYRELLELTVIFLGGVPHSGEVKFKQPGAMSSARWMAKALYCLKLCLFRKQLLPELTPTEANGLIRIAVFIIKLYVRAWFSAPDSVAAPRLDLQFLRDLKDYEKVNKKVALAALERFLFHTWYLTEVNVGFSVFDEEIPYEVRGEIVQKMLASTVTEREPSKKVDKRISMKEIPQLEILDFVSGNTRRFFSILDLKTEFLSIPPAQWAARNDYQESREIVTHLRSVNDTAERAVALMKDYNQVSTKKEDNFQNLLIGVSDMRKSLPQKTKEMIVKKFSP